ncbi:MAG: hypothetical protein WAW36_14570 [Methylovulum miyakonense]|uniref:hypothetical protein n=1 Tax=Methylovulum miyakonense TaxID=645578 RepID=UPI003BB5E8D3
MAGLRKAVAAAWSRHPDSMEPTVPPDLPVAVQVGPSALNFDVRPVHAPATVRLRRFAAKAASGE